MTHKEKVLRVLSDGMPHSHHELYALGCIAHSRISDLRRDGYQIDCWTDTLHGERLSVYKLVSSPEPAAPPLSPAAGSEGESGPCNPHALAPVSGRGRKRIHRGVRDREPDSPVAGLRGTVVEPEPQPQPVPTVSLSPDGQLAFEVAA